MQDTEREAILETGFAQAEKITKKYAKTFYFASPFLSKEGRCAAYAVYAVCRITDDYVDGKHPDAASQKLVQIEADIDKAYADGELKDPLLLAFRNSIKTYAIPRQYFHDIMAGMRMDLDKQRYADFSQLHDYCYKVAGVVGLIMLQIFDAQAQEARPYAIDLGVALQLTNIIRDIKEDFARGRIYLPQEDLQRFGISQEDFAQEKLSQNFKALLGFQIQRARQYYSRSLTGLNFIKDRNNRFLILAIKQMYAAILEVIEKSDYDIFSKRAQVGNFKKIAIMLGLFLRAK
jgi:phytoene synthase